MLLRFVVLIHLLCPGSAFGSDLSLWLDLTPQRLNGEWKEALHKISRSSLDEISKLSLQSEFEFLSGNYDSAHYLLQKIHKISQNSQKELSSYALQEWLLLKAILDTRYLKLSHNLAKRTFKRSRNLNLLQSKPDYVRFARQLYYSLHYDLENYEYESFQQNLLVLEKTFAEIASPTHPVWLIFLKLKTHFELREGYEGQSLLFYFDQNTSKFLNRSSEFFDSNFTKQIKMWRRFYRAHYITAANYSKEILELSQGRSSLSRIARIHWMKTDSYMRSRDFALAHYELRKFHDSLPGLDEKLRGITLMTRVWIASTMSRDRKLSSALDLLRKTIKKWEEEIDTEQRSYYYAKSELARLEMESGFFNRALALIEKTRDEAREILNPKDPLLARLQRMSILWKERYYGVNDDEKPKE